MQWLTPRRQDHFSRFFGDLAKAIFAVGLASHFFKGLPDALRVAFGVGFFALSGVSFWVCPRE